MVVDDEFRKRGIGTKLLRLFEAVAIQLDIRKLELFVEQTKVDARRLYVKLGFLDEDGGNVGTQIKMAKYIRK